MTTPTAHETLVSVIVVLGGPSETIACIQAVEEVLAGVSHEIVIVYQNDDDAVHAIEAMGGGGLAHRLRLLRSDDRTEGGALRSGFKAAAGDVVVPFLVGKDNIAVLTSIVDLANVIRAERAAIAIASAPRGKGAVRAGRLAAGGHGRDRGVECQHRISGLFCGIPGKSGNRSSNRLSRGNGTGRQGANLNMLRFAAFDGVAVSRDSRSARATAPALDSQGPAGASNRLGALAGHGHSSAGR